MNTADITQDVLQFWGYVKPPVLSKILSIQKKTKVCSYEKFQYGVGDHTCLLYVDYVKKKLSNHEISKTNMALSYVLFISWLDTQTYVQFNNIKRISDNKGRNYRIYIVR